MFSYYEIYNGMNSSYSYFLRATLHLLLCGRSLKNTLQRIGAGILLDLLRW